jgi:alpha-tubulin suppressor-like RCC1 family protein
VRARPSTLVLAVAAGTAVGAAAGLGAVACGVDATVLREGAGDDASTSADAAPDVGADATTFDGIGAADANIVNSGQYFACALSSGSASCWGDNEDDNLGIGNDLQQTAPRAVDSTAQFALVALGDNHACAIRAPDASVVCWGDNTYGQIGNGGGMPSYASPQPVALPGPARWVTAGYEHACAVLDDGSLWCWGDNREGQLGLNDAYGSPNASKPVRVGNAVDWITVSGGEGHTCAVRAPGTMWCWGRNTNYELGLGTTNPDQLRAPTQVGMLTDWTFVELGQDDACALRADGTLWGWGDGTPGQLAAPPGKFPSPTQIGTDKTWTTVSTDTFSSCGIESGGALFCWGRNIEGQLGVGDTTDRTMPTATGNGSLFGSVSVGRFFTCAESLSLQVLCTGADDHGQLGVGDTMRRNVFTAVSLPQSK